MICPFEKNMETPGAVGLNRNIFMITPWLHKQPFTTWESILSGFLHAGTLLDGCRLHKSFYSWVLGMQMYLDAADEF